MSKKVQRVASWLTLAALMLTGVVIGYSLTHWQEDKFVGRPVTALEDFLSKDNRYLEKVDPHTFYAVTQHRLSKNERGTRFRKGRQIRFGLGSAIRLGYVVVDRDDNTIKSIFHGESIDSL
jgi:hypothetical protein